VGNQDPLLGMAYACLTLLEKGNRKLAAKHYAIHNDVLRKLGELTSTRGDNATARKISDRTTPLSERERVRLFFCILSSVCYTRITPYGYKTQFVQG
jgi:hypothetical protein